MCTLERVRTKSQGKPAVEGVGLTPSDHLSENKELPSNGRWIFGSWLCFAFGLNLQLSEMVRKIRAGNAHVLLQGNCSDILSRAIAGRGSLSSYGKINAEKP